MSISLFASNDINRLSSLVSQHIHHQMGQIDPFAPIHIVTQTEGMNVWLKTKLAEQLGISANIQFHTPQEIIHTVYQKLGASSTTEKFSKESIQWMLFEEMNKAAFLSNPSFKIIKDYCQNDDRKRLSLAGELADLFDQYMIYRFDLIEQWNKPNDSCTDFQEYLWKRLKSVLKEQLNDKSEVRQIIIDRLKNAEDQEIKSGLSDIRNIFFFGLSIFTPYHMEIFRGLSEHIEMKFYFLNPSPSVYWYEDKPEKSIRWLDQMNISHAKSLGNNLLTNWGRIIQESFYLFLDCDEAVNAYHDEVIPVQQPDTLLGKIQQQIIHNETDIADTFTIADIEDGTLNIHSNYTKAREVETLYNYLVSLTERDKTITGKDIIVSCDIDEYAPYIHAVFDTAPYSFKYTIADSAYVQGDNPIQALKSFLLLSEENFNAEEIFQLLEYSSIKNKFGINNIELIKTVIRKSLFRFGMEGNKEDDSFLFSLKYAIQKIIYGVTIRTDNLYNGFYPLDILEGLDSMDGIRFCLFGEKLIDLMKKREKPKKISEWALYIEEVMQELIFQDEENDDSILRYQELIIKNLSKYHCVSDHLQEEIPYNLFASHLIHLIGKDKRESKFVSHGITFCSYIPMRSLPFKVVCMLGMDFDKFPRKDTRLSFSHIDGQFRSGQAVIKSKRRRGDRNIRDNDKHLFLENMMSAKQFFYLSYIGNSVKDNSIIPTSVFIDELIHYIAENSNDPDAIRKKIIVRHPLHSFSQKYNTDPRLINYLINDNISEEILITKNDAAEAEQPIQLETLIRFFKNPIEYYYKNILGIYFGKEDAILPVTETFEMDHLEQWKIKNVYVSDNDHFNFRDLIIQGAIPPANMGQAQSEKVLEEFTPLRDKILQEKENLEQKITDIEIQCNTSITLTGRIENLYGNKLISYSLSDSKSKRKDSIRHILQYLCLRASGMDVLPVFISNDGKLVSHHTIDKSTAIQYLNSLVDLFIKGHKEILPLFLEFDIPPSNLPAVNDTSAFREFALSRFKKIEDSIYAAKPEYRLKDEYVLNLIQNKFFETEENILALFRNTSIVYNIISTIYKKKLL